MKDSDTDKITFVITSCGRFDLLDQCLASFLAHNTAPISRYLLVEDSGNPRVRDVVARFDVPIEVIVNDPPLGQIAAIDRAYSSVVTPYIFHCEDDWRFFRSGFIEESLPILKHDPAATAVLSRRLIESPAVKLLLNCPVQSVARVRYRRPPPWLVPEWHGYSFNPGLRRLSDYRRLGSFARWGHEVDASLYFKLRGRTLAFLADPACETTGAERRLAKQSPKRSVRARWQFLKAKCRYKVSRFNATKGDGFIQPSDGGKDVFVHISAVERAGLSNPAEGQKIDYELTTGRNGKSSAENWRVK
jgi:cold shock CspA family protein